MKTIYELQLHEEMTLSRRCTIMRVAGGWNYIYECGVQFVSYDSEFEYTGKIQNLMPQRVIYCVRDFFKLPNNFIESGSKAGHIPLAKKFIMKFLHENLDMTHTEIAEYVNLGRSMVTIGLHQITEILYKKRNINEQYKIIYGILNKTI